MTKKPRSQRRKKGRDLGDNNDTDNDGVAAAAGNDVDAEYLPEEFTIADTISAFSRDDFSAGTGGGSDNTDTDDYLTGHARDENAAAAAAEARLMKLGDALSNLQEFASLKRGAKREAILQRCFKALTQYATGRASVTLVEEQFADVIRTACTHGLRAGPPSEQYAACRVLEATSVILGSDQDAWWCESLDRPLRRVVLTAQRAAPVRAAALRALSMAVFIGSSSSSSDTMTTEGLMDLCEQVAQPTFRNEPVPACLRATGLDCWALLATTVADIYLAGQDDVQVGRGIGMLNLLKDCLDDAGSIELRSAAGECLALIHESRLALGCTDEGENVTARRFQPGSWEGSQWEEVMDEAKQRIAELSVESSHFLSKKAKKEQRATFREFMATIVDDEAPEEVINFRRGGSISLNSWREIIQLNFCRHCLQGGFQTQLLMNETLQVIFGTSGLHGATGNMSQLEKRLLMSKTSEAAKEADIKLSRKRDKRENIKNHFLTADGEDI